MRITPFFFAVAAAFLILAVGALEARAEKDITNPLTGEVVVMKFAKTPSAREVTKTGQKLGRKTLEVVLSAAAPGQAAKLAGCLSGSK
ncbi:hypothetical protein [Desulfolutivibrio sp.]|uniref:hypothetical protein n=1 Tax=Desulfolutivibrio sp. TaxID=2773296 RepID=UPI002F962943